MRCFFCHCRLTAERSAQSNACVACGERELAAIYAPRRNVKRIWVSNSVEAQTVQASASLKYRAPKGHYCYVREDLPGRAFRTRDAALQ